MPYTLKTQQIAVKDPDTGVYSGVDILAEQTTEGLLTEITATGEAVKADVSAQMATERSDFNTYVTNKETELNNYTTNKNQEIATMIADADEDVSDLEDRKQDVATAVSGMLSKGVDNSLTTANVPAESKAVGDLFETIVQGKSTQPNDKWNRLWIKPSASDYEIPTMDEFDDLKSALSNVAISDNVVICQAIKELYIDGADLSQVNSLSVNKSSGCYNFVFRNGDTVVLTLGFTLTGGVRVGYDMTNSILGFAVFDDRFDSLMLSDRLYGTFNETKISSLTASPFISKYIFGGNNCFIPEFTRTTSKRISTSGTIDNASSWFYSSPISVNSGDIINFQCAGNSSAAPLSLTDVSGSFYSPCIVYSGTDPDSYTYVCIENGYVCWSIPTGFPYYIYITRAEGNGKFVYANYSAENEGKVLGINSSGAVVPITIAAGGTGGIPIEAMDYSIRKPNVVKTADIESLSGWVANGASISLAKKYNNVTKLNRQCVCVTSVSGNGLAYYEFDSAVNANQKALLFEICIGEYDDTTPPSGDVAVEMYSGSGRSSTYKASFVIQGNTIDSSYNPVYNHNGWFIACLFFPSVDDSRLMTVGAKFDPTNVTAVGVHPYNTNSKTNTVYVADLAFVNPMQKPGICTIIDNFGVSVPAMADYAYSKGVRLNLSIIPGFYAGERSAPTCASKAELDRVAQQGHCIWNHTWTHAILNKLSYGQVHDQVNLAETWMQINGYGDFKEFVSNPSARFNTATCNALLETNIKMLFHKWVGSPNCVYIPYYPTLRCIPTTVLDQEVSTTMSGTDIGTVAQKAITYGGITVVGFHGTYWELDNGVSWKAYIDKIASIQNIYHYGLDEIYNGQWY